MENGVGSSRKYDVILWGASGFTGSLVAEFLLSRYGVDKELNWAIAGRSEKKLITLKERLGCIQVDHLIADSHDKASLDSLTKQTKVICTTVGPYAHYGTKLVQSCIDNSTDYCDLTGEVQWIRQMIDQYHELASERGVKIVHCCGFDSIPSDMGVYFFQTEAKKLTGEYLDHIKFRVRAIKGGVSGGTLASLNNVMEESKQNKDVAQIVREPYSLNPTGMRKGMDKTDLTRLVFDPDLNEWISPFVMAGINTKVVRRSHALMNFEYGMTFKYDEAILNGKGPKGRLKGVGQMAFLGVLLLGGPNTIPGKIISKFMPKPGEGPSQSERENGFFKIILHGKFEGGSFLRAQVTGDRDPGYGSTSKMLGESAVCLAKDRKDLPPNYGIITPSIAMGSKLLSRLQENAGLSFTMLN